MENIKNLLGSAYHENITIEEINSALEGKKYVDLSSGEYVAKGKYTTLEEKYKTLQSEHDSYKEQTKDYETLKTENEAFKGEKATNELKGKLQTLGIDPKYFNYVKVDIDSKTLDLGEDETKHQEVASEYLKSHPEFAIKTGGTGTQRTASTSVEGGTGKTMSINERLHAGLCELAGVKPESNN